MAGRRIHPRSLPVCEGGLLQTKRNESYGTGRIAFEMCGGRPALYKGDMFSSITFDPGICQSQDTYQIQEFKESLKMSQGRAFGAFTFLLDIDFPKANLQGNV